MSQRRPGETRGERAGGRPGARAGGRPGGSRAPATRGASSRSPLAGGGESPGSGASSDAVRRRSRFTGRAAVLVGVLLVLMMSYASSMKAYLEQRAHMQELRAQIARQEQRIETLEREKLRWEDPAYVRMQARERFGYVLPGEQSFVVVDGNGKPLDPEGTLSDPASVAQQEPVAWWDSAWASVTLAGHPPKDQAPPAQTIREGGQ